MSDFEVTRNMKGEIAAARRAAFREAAALLDEAAARLLGGRSRVNQVDRHVAEVLKSKATEIFALRDRDC